MGAHHSSRLDRSQTPPSESHLGALSRSEDRIYAHTTDRESHFLTMRWACFSLLVLALLGLFAYEFVRHEPSWDEAPEDEEARGLEEGSGADGWLDPWPWLWRRGTEEAAGPGFQRRRLGEQRRRLLRGEKDARMVLSPAPGRPPHPPAAAGWRRLQLLEAGGLRPFEVPANFSTAGLRRAPPYLALSNCYYRPQCFNVTTPGYGTVERCKLGRICEVCRGLLGRQNCSFVRVTGSPGSLGAQTSLSNVVIPGD